MSVINDFKDEFGRWVKTTCTNYKQDYTKSGRVWNDMQQRCLVGGYQQTKFPRYVGCTMSDKFKDFEFFAEWYVNQVGYGIDKYHLDKDILFEGNKLYSEDTCVLVPASLNTFMVSHNASRGIYPQGVAFHKLTEKFSASIMVDGKARHLGVYVSPEQASSVYKSAKETQARRWHMRLKAGEFVVDPRVTERMRVWTLTPESN